MDRSHRSVPATLALGLFGLFLAVAVPRSAWQAVQTLRQAVRNAGESPLERRRRIFGAEYVDAVEAIRRAIPPGGAYLLVNGANVDEAALFLVRYELAPRRAVFAGRLRGLRDHPRQWAKKVPPDLPWVVIAREGDDPPEWMTREEFLERMRRHDLRHVR